MMAESKILRPNAVVHETATAPWLPVMLRVCGFAALLAAGAAVRVPMPGTPVPVTLQTLAVLLCGFYLRPKEAVSAVALYLAAGAAGLPVFAGIRMVTLGYLAGFLIAAAVLSMMVRSMPRLDFGRSAAAGALATFIILICGVAWLGIVQRDLALAIQVGLLPFLLGAGIKTVLAALIVQIRPPSSGC